jgi:hypothetical protein
MRTHALALALSLALALVAGCLEGRNGDPDVPAPTATTSPTTPTAGTPTPTPTTPATGEEGPLGLRTLGGGQVAGTRAMARLAFTNAEAFNDFWMQVRETEDPAPAVDFARETAVAAVAGASSNTCWGLRITNATEEAGATTVEVTTFRPPPDMICGQMITYPWHVVSLAGAGRAVEFTEVESDGPMPSEEEG